MKMRLPLFSTNTSGLAQNEKPRCKQDFLLF